MKIYHDIGYKIRDCTKFTSCETCVQRGCHWCFDPFTFQGQCGDRDAAPFFNAKCDLSIFHDVSVSEQCPLPSKDDILVWNAKDHEDSKNRQDKDQDEEEEQDEDEGYDVILSARSNECIMWICTVSSIFRAGYVDHFLQFSLVLCYLMFMVELVLEVRKTSTATSTSTITLPLDVANNV
jgi:hypothetical protein